MTTYCRKRYFNIDKNASSKLYQSKKKERSKKEELWKWAKKRKSYQARRVSLRARNTTQSK